MYAFQIISMMFTIGQTLKVKFRQIEYELNTNKIIIGENNNIHHNINISSMTSK